MNPHITLHDVRCRLASCLLATAFFLFPVSFVSAQTVTGSKGAVYPLNNDNSARPGDTITYTITTGNGAAAVTNANNVQIADTIDPNSTFVNNSAKVSANAIAHGYNAAGNTQLSVNAAAGLLNGVVDIDGVTPSGSLVVTAGTFPTSAGGSVTIAANGSFVYTPQTGDQNLNDTFSYTVTDGDGLPSTGLVTINLGARVWYVDSTYAGANGPEDGSSLKPFNALSDISGATGPDAIGDIIFIVERAGDYDGNLTLLNTQLLYGSGANLTVNTIVINTAGSNTTMVTTAAGTNSITLASGNTVIGFTIGNTTGSKIFGNGFGTLVLTNVTLQGAGQALNLTNGTFGDATGPGTGCTFNSVTSTSGANNINLVTVAGKVNLGSGALSGATGTSFLNGTAAASSGGSAAIDYSGTITQTTSGQAPILMQNRTGGTVNFTGAVTATAAGVGGVSLLNNTGSTINFTGGLNLSTSTNAAFTATGGGTVSATQNNTSIVNTLTTTTGTALNVANTTIGVNELTFRSISVTGNNTSPANGIILTNTGTNGFNIVGNGGACTAATPTCTGGTIQGTGSHGIWFTNVSNIEFTRIRIHNTGDHGIFGDGVNNFSLIDSYIHDFGNTAGAAVSEDAMHFESTNLANIAAGHGLTGTVIIQRAQFGPDSAFIRSPNPPLPENKGIVIRNHNDVNLNMTVTGSKFIQISNDGIDADVRNETSTAGGVGTATINVDGSTADGTNTFDNINGRAVVFQNAVDNAAARIFDLTIKNNTFNSVGIGGRWAAAGRGTMNARYNNNTMTATSNDAIRSESDAVNGALTPHATVNATVTGNNMGGGSIFISLHREALTNMAFNSNTNIGGTAAGAGGCATCTGVQTGINLRSDRGSTLNIDLLSNTGTANGSLAFAQSALDMQATTNGGGNSTICANIGGAGALKNTLTQSPDTAGQQVISIDPVGGSTIRIQGGPGGSPGTENFLIANNTLNGTNKVAISTPAAVPSGVGFDCVTSTPLFVSSGGVAKAGETQAFEAMGTCGPSSAAAEAAVEPIATVATKPAAQAFQAQPLNQADLDSVVATAISRWSATGLDDHQLATLRSLKFEVADLPSIYLGDASADRIRVDNNAGGNGWFIDASENSDGLFKKDTSSTRGYTDPADAPAGRIDLLTTIMHEMGHAMGLADSYVEQDRDSLMYGFLTKGERRLPSKGQAVGAIPGSVSGTHFLNLPVVIGTLNPGTTVSMQFQATVNSAGFCGNITNTANISGSNFATVNTNTTTVPVHFPPNMFSAQTPPATGTQDFAYAGYTFVANGCPAPTYALAPGSPALPPGLMLAANGALTGTPTTAGTYSNIIVRATNTAGVLDTTPFTITIAAPITFDTASPLAPWTKDHPGYNQTIMTSGGTGAKTYAVTAGIMPTNLTLDGNTGAITGTPTPAATFNFTITATDSLGATTAKAYQIVINPVVTVTPATLPNGTVGVAYGPETVMANNGTGAKTFSAPSGTLPPGLSFNTGTGVLDGTPTTPGSYMFTITATDTVGATGSQAYTIVIKQNTTTTLMSSQNPSPNGIAVTFTATVDEVGAPPGTPTGTVTFFDGASPITCEPPSNGTLSGGQATCTTSTLSVAGSPHNITAQYTGDATYNGSTSAILQQNVINCPNPAIVTKIADTNDGICDADCSLREAIAQVCPGGTITFDTGGVFATPQTIVLSTSFGALTINENVTIQGPGTAQQVTVQGSGNVAHRVFILNAGKTATIQNLKITGGSADALGGAGILNEGNLTLQNSTVSGNTTTFSGGGIFNNSVLTVFSSTVSGNTANDGAGIHQTATATSLALTNSTLSGNNANGFAGGVDVLGGTATITNCTITNNRADNDVGAGGSAGGIRQQGGTLTLHNTIVAANFIEAGVTDTDSDIDGAVDPASSFNLVGVDTGMTGITHGSNGNQVGTAASPIDPLLGGLANNGGPTQTHRLTGTSSAIDAGDNSKVTAPPFSGPPFTDQRQLARIVDGPDGDATATVDIGSVEVNYMIAATAGTPQSTGVGTPFAIDLEATVSESGIPISGVSVTFTAPGAGASGTFAA
ncbi:MAG TPA: putative Ig domain-containing protein, partial [Chthoniobacterales bacterium]|nr:putative Ig domain-containing protein [Chthoniobacterales bacterium]